MKNALKLTCASAIISVAALGSAMAAGGDGDYYQGAERDHIVQPMQSTPDVRHGPNYYLDQNSTGSISNDPYMQPPVDRDTNGLNRNDDLENPNRY